MAYTDHYKLADDVIDHLNTVISGISDPFVATRYVGFVAIVSVTVYELAIKEIFVEFGEKKHKVLGEFTRSYFSRINGRIKVVNIRDEYIMRYGDKYVNRFKGKLTEAETQNLRDKGISIQSSYANIITERQFKDFELRFEWKIEPGSNSGVMFHVQEGPKMPYLTGPEYQVLDNEGFRGGTGNPVSREEYTGSHYAIEAPLVDAMKPVGEWNQSRILVVGNEVEYWLNGAMTASYEMHSPKWNAQIAAAKFAKWERFGTTTEGHFALQDHGHGAHYRNIKVKSL